MAQFTDDPNTNSLLIREFLNRAKNVNERNSIISFIAGEDVTQLIRDMDNNLVF